LDWVLKNHQSDPNDDYRTAARDQLTQQLLIGLADGYQTSVVMQASVNVSAGCTSPTTAAQLWGKPVGRVPTTSGTGDDLNDLAASVGVGAAYVVVMFAAMPSLLQANCVVAYPNKPQYTIQATDTLSDLMVEFGATPEQLAANLTVVSGAPLLRAS